nr:putative reverse transcriptase domain, ribonuclease H-like domain, aspartic peptidase domain protein [Tanacetum cinerariifolium]
MGESSHESTLEQQGKQIEEILNHLDELPLDRIEQIEDDVEGLASTMSQASIRKLVADSVTTALETQTTIMAKAGNPIRNTRPIEIPVAKRGNYKEFISCQLFYFNGMEGVVGLIRWFERTELVFSRSNCAEENKVAFATGTLTNDALLLKNKYYPRTEIKKMEDEFYNLSLKGNDLKNYVRRFQELVVLCPNMVPNNEKLLEVFIDGLPKSIKGNVTASKPQTLEEAINIVQRKEKLYAKFSKCDSWIKTVQFLGHLIDSQRLQVDPAKIEAVKNWASPTTPTEIPLPEGNDDFVIYCDASIQGLGVVLMQRVIAYASRKLKPHKEIYTTHDLELGAVVFALKIWRHYLCGTKCIVFTDHKSLQHVLNQKELNIRQHRWLELLAYYDCEIRYHPGKANEENVEAENLRGMEKAFEICTDGTRCIKNRSWSPLFDRDSHFTSRFWQSLQNALGSQLDMSTAYHPETDGQSERTIQTLEDMLRACAIDFGKGWEKHLPFVEFSYNNSYHAIIKAAPFEALYGRKCRSPVCRAEVGDTQLTGPEIIHETTKKIVQIRQHLQAARDRQRNYANVRRKPLEFQAGDRVMLKISPRKGIIRFGKRGKLNLGYIGPFKILKRVGPMAYKLELPEELSNVHNTFHVSNLKKCLSDESLIILMKELKLDDKLDFVEESVEIMDREIKQLRQSRIPIIKVRWNSKRGPEYTWECKDEIRDKYPHLFFNISLSSS